MIGIYRIRRKETGKCYIGKSKNINKRWECHLNQLNANVHHNLHLQHSWAKNGKDAFEFEIIEECSLEELDAREEHWIGKEGYYNHADNSDRFIFRKMPTIDGATKNGYKFNDLISEGVLIANYDNLTVIGKKPVTSINNKKSSFWWEVQKMLEEDNL